MNIVRPLFLTGAAILLLHLTACSENTIATAKLPDDVATVGIQVKSAVRKLKVNDKAVLPISISNNGVASIPSNGKPDRGLQVFATYHWMKLSGEVALWDGVRTALPEDIQMGKTLDLQLDLKAPAEPGKYILVIDLVQEGAFWFESKGSQTARMEYQIES